MLKKIVIALGIVLVLIVVLVLKTFRDAGEFATLASHSDCTCSRVDNVPGAEDIAIDPSTGMAFISSSDRRALMKGNMIQGAIYSYNLEGKPVLKNLTADLKIGFYPHGISFYKGEDGRKFLFVVNHRQSKNYIEIFEYRNDTLSHLETVGGDQLISPNDVAGVGPRQFYFTNDHGSASPFFRHVEDYLQLSRANVTYFDGKQFRNVADGIGYANGIWASRDGKTLYVSSTTGKKFYAYNRSADGSLKLITESSLGTGLDNIDIDGNGVIRIAGHPKLLTFTKHAGDEKIKSPSQILEVARDDKGGYCSRETYLGAGDEISAASVAAVYKKRLLVGSVFERFFLDCTMK